MEKLFHITRKKVNNQPLTVDERSWRERYCADMRTHTLHGPEDYLASTRRTGCRSGPRTSATLPAAAATVTALRPALERQVAAIGPGGGTGIGYFVLAVHELVTMRLLHERAAQRRAAH
ncbi:hypothetical protein [Micromonospora thermarum]|uniref:hypothetical protein n=1 Tax=Micromonospora thermarum TaxID=2720024 RepID=UPI00197BD297|nr:hypothetical protein [Micromonospora thermarum]